MADGHHMQTGQLFDDKTATFSPSRKYRYTLWRRWNEGPYAMFIGLNPSTADETTDDPTVRRCIRFARDWGYGAMYMMNIFAIRATNPKVMLNDPEPIGPDNDYWLRTVGRVAAIIVAAWGTHGRHMDRGKAVLHLFSDVHCLKLTKDGIPGHPLYLRADSQPFRVA